MKKYPKIRGNSLVKRRGMPYVHLQILLQLLAPTLKTFLRVPMIFKYFVYSTPFT